MVTRASWSVPFLGRTDQVVAGLGRSSYSSGASMVLLVEAVNQTSGRQREAMHPPSALGGMGRIGGAAVRPAPVGIVVGRRRRGSAAGGRGRSLAILAAAAALIGSANPWSAGRGRPWSRPRPSSSAAQRLPCWRTRPRRAPVGAGSAGGVSLAHDGSRSAEPSGHVTDSATIVTAVRNLMPGMGMSAAPGRRPGTAPGARGPRPGSGADLVDEAQAGRQRDAMMGSARARASAPRPAGRTGPSPRPGRRVRAVSRGPVRRRAGSARARRASDEAAGVADLAGRSRPRACSVGAQQAARSRVATASFFTRPVLDRPGREGGRCGLDAGIGRGGRRNEPAAVRRLEHDRHRLA